MGKRLAFGACLVGTLVFGAVAGAQESFALGALAIICFFGMPIVAMS